jgi:hypothetical protein
MRTANSWAARGAVILLLSTTGTTLATAPAQACMPLAPGSDPVADTVFVGTALRSAGGNTYDVRVSDIYKGSPGRAWIVVDGGDLRTDVGLELEPRRQYVFYAIDDPGSMMWTVGACGGTTPVTERALAEAESEYGPATPLRGVSGPPPSTDQSGDDGAADDSTAGEENPSPAADSDDQVASDDDAALWPWVGGGAVVAVIVGAGIVVLRRRASTT